MARNHYEPYYNTGAGINIFSAVMAGVLLGAAFVFMSDDRNRMKVKEAFESLKEKGENKAEELKDEGLKRVSKELAKAQKKIDKR